MFAFFEVFWRVWRGEEGILLWDVDGNTEEADGLDAPKKGHSKKHNMVIRNGNAALLPARRVVPEPKPDDHKFFLEDET